ncbi:MAG TPA: large conductance mechanosensitive channel protein MscL [Ktedonobacterales bacterium]|jgi:large conductance mechanosensitive channel
MNTLKEFKAFVLRGNVVDLAVGIVIGAAFGTVVAALVKDFITPLISIPGKADFSNLVFTIHGSPFHYGDFINAVISFVLIAAAVFFFVVKPVNMLMARAKTEPPPDPTTRNCPHCLSTIPSAATKCAFCTADVEAVMPAEATAKA